MPQIRILALSLFIGWLNIDQVKSQSISDVAVVQTLTGEEIDFLQLVKEERIVLVFYSVDCPLCKKYTRRLNDIQNENSNEIKLYAVFAGEHQKKKKIKKFLKKYELDVDVFVDPKYELVDALEARITPESFLISNSEVVYRGALDDWVIKLGSTKSEVRNPYLKNAIKASIEGKDISPEAVKAIGCFIR